MQTISSAFSNEETIFMSSDFWAISRLLFLATICVLLAVTAFQTPGWYSLLGDIDSYTRLTRVWHFIQTGHWYDNHFPYYNTPWGIELHWTKPLDVCLLLSASLLKPFMAFKDALYYGSFVWNPLFLFGAALSLAWGVYPTLGRTGALFVGLMMLMQPFAFGNAGPTRVDHHIMEMCLQCMALALCLRAPLNERALGLVLALGIWVAIEFGIFSAFLIGCLYFIFPVSSLRRVLFWLATGLSVAVILERGPDILNYLDVQRLSLFHVFMAWVSYGSMATLSGFVKDDMPLSQKILGGCLLMAFLIVVFAVYVALLKVHLQIVDPRIKSLWFDQVDEMRNAFTHNHFDYSILMVTGGAFVGIIASRWMTRAQRVLLIPGLVLYTVFTFYQRRQGYYLSPYIAVTMGLLGGHIIKAVHSPLKVSASLIALLIQPLVLTAIVWKLEPSQSNSSQGAVSINSLISVVTHATGLNSRVLVLPELESAALVWHMGVEKNMGSVYPPYHQNVDGILDGMVFRTTNDPDALKTILKKRGITHVLFARPPGNSPNARGTAMARLGTNPHPPYLREIPLPGDVGEKYLLFDVDASMIMPG